MTGDDLYAEWQAASADVSAGDREQLAELGIDARDVEKLIGSAAVRLCRGGDPYEPDDAGRACLVTPVRVDVDSPLSPESTQPHIFVRVGPIVDLVAWHPAAAGKSGRSGPAPANGWVA